MSALEKQLHADELRNKAINEALEKGKMMKAESKEQRQ